MKRKKKKEFAGGPFYWTENKGQAFEIHNSLRAREEGKLGQQK